MAVEIVVPQQDGEIVVTFAGQPPIVLAVADGRVSVEDGPAAQAVLASVEGAYRAEDAPVAAYDPAFHTIDEVNEHLDEHPDQVAAVLAVEARRRPEVPESKQRRTGILAGRHAPADDSPADEPAEQEEG